MCVRVCLYVHALHKQENMYRHTCICVHKHDLWNTADEQKKLNNKSSKKKLNNNSSTHKLSKHKDVEDQVALTPFGVACTTMMGSLSGAFIFLHMEVCVGVCTWFSFINNKCQNKHNHRAYTQKKWIERAITHTCTKHNTNLCKNRVYSVVELLCAPANFLPVINCYKGWGFMTPLWWIPQLYFVHLYSGHPLFYPMPHILMCTLCIQAPDVQPGLNLAISCVHTKE